MSLVRIKGEVDDPKPYYAVQVGTRREGPLDDPFWMVYFDGPDGHGYPYEDYEIERVPAHRGKYDPNHYGERDPEMYNRESVLWAARHRKEGEAN